MRTAFIDATARVSDTETGEGARIYASALVEHTSIGAEASIGDRCVVKDARLAEHVEIGRGCGVYSSELGRYSCTGMNTMLLHAQIGAFCSISWNVSIGGANHDHSRMTTHSLLYDPKWGFCGDAPAYDRFESECVLGSDVWIAANACILRGVHVGHGAVIGAGAVVTRDVPAYAVAVGAPARVVKMRFDDATVERLLALAWWTRPEEEIRAAMPLLGQKPNAENLEKIEAMLRRSCRQEGSRP